jgi:prepilin-type N-terminal cleavage/methylation domain-containing protein
MFKTLKEDKGFTLVEILVVVIIVAILAAISVSTYTKYVDKAKSTEAQVAISAIENAYDFHLQAYGTTDNYSIDQAMKDSGIRKAVERKWKFEVIGNPPTRYVATSTSDFSSGEGKQVYYDVDEGKFHGFGIDEDYDDKY